MNCEVCHRQGNTSHGILLTISILAEAFNYIEKSKSESANCSTYNSKTYLEKAFSSILKYIFKYSLTNRHHLHYLRSAFNKKAVMQYFECSFMDTLFIVTGFEKMNLYYAYPFFDALH